MVHALPASTDAVVPEVHCGFQMLVLSNPVVQQNLIVGVWAGLEIYGLCYAEHATRDQSGAEHESRQCMRVEYQ